MPYWCAALRAGSDTHGEGILNPLIKEEEDMSKKEEKARQYSNQKVKEKDLYPSYSANTKRRLTTFDAYELEDAFEAGWDAAIEEALKWIKENIGFSECNDGSMEWYVDFGDTEEMLEDFKATINH